MVTNCVSSSACGPLMTNLAHVADVEQPDAFAHGLVLLQYAGVFDRHVPTAEIDHLGAGAAMHGVQRSFFQTEKPARLMKNQANTQRLIFRVPEPS